MFSESNITNETMINTNTQMISTAFHALQYLYPNHNAHSDHLPLRIKILL